MPTSCRRVLAVVIASAFAATVGVASVCAQFRAVHTPERPVEDSEVNIFASWAGADRIHGAAVELPAGWSVISATILRDGYTPVSANIRTLNGNRFAVLAAEELRGQHELIFRVRVGSSLGSNRISVMPVFSTGGKLVTRESLKVERDLRPYERISDPDNFVFSFADARQPLLLRRTRTPALSLRKSFSLSFWFKTVNLGEVLLSTWNGDESQGYPLELVVDVSGKLRCFRGRPGEHQSLASGTPVADGSWHRVVITNSPNEGWMRMSLDGKTIDSLYSAVPLPIAMELPLSVGGRVPGRKAYFDGLRGYSSLIDDIRIQAEGEEGIRIDFEQRPSADLLQEPVRGARRERSDLVFHRPIREFRAAAGAGGIVLSWHAADPQLIEFIVERSPDGREFEPTKSVAADIGGDGRYSVIDRDAGGRIAYYRVRQKYRGGGERLSGTIKVGLGMEQPESVLLIGNFPNPFNAATTITYEVRESAYIRLSIWDLAGQQVATLVDREQGPGTYDVQFAAVDLPSGTYFVRMQTDSGIKSHKMILTK